MLELTTYHKILRILVVVGACVLVFQSGLIIPQTAELAGVTQRQVASVVGMNARVEPTELNQYTAALTAKERELAEREAAITEREISLSRQGVSSSDSYSTFILSAILFIFLVLLVLNYTLDYLRAREDRLQVVVQ